MRRIELRRRWSGPARMSYVFRCALRPSGKAPETSQAPEHEHHDDRHRAFHIKLIDDIVRQHGGHHRKRSAHDTGDDNKVQKRFIFQRTDQSAQRGQFSGSVVYHGLFSNRQARDENCDGCDYAKDQAYPCSMPMHQRFRCCCEART